MRLIKTIPMVFLLLLFVLASVSEVKAEPVRLKMSATQPRSHPNYLALKHLEELLKEKAPNRFNITVYGGMELGDDLSVQRHVRTGSVHLATNTTTNLSNISSAMAICDLPYLFKDTEEALAVLDGPFGEKLFDQLHQDGPRIQGLAYIPADFRQIFNRKRPINSIEDLNGLKIRTAESQMDIAAVRSLGGNPTPMDFSEVYSGIEQGVIDGVAIPALLGHAMQFDDVAHYLAMLDTQLFTLVWFVNNQWYQNLPADLKEVFNEAVKDARDWQMEKTAEMNKELLDKLSNKGIHITKFSTQDKKPFIEAARRSWDNFKGEKISGKWFDRIEKAKADIK